MIDIVNYIFLFYAVVIGPILIFRNWRVYKFRMKVIHRIHELNQKDISANKPSSGIIARYKAISNVGYNEMIFKFWRPYESYFPEELTKDL